MWKRRVFSANGARFAQSSASGKTLQLWDAVSGASIGSLALGERIWAVAFSPDGELIASASWKAKGEIQLWKVHHHEAIKALRMDASNNMNYAITAIALSPDNTQVVCGSSEETIHIWDVSTGIHSMERLDYGHVMCIVYSPDGKRIAWGSHHGHVGVAHVGADPPRFMIDTEVRKDTRFHEDNVRSVVFSPNGTKVVSASTRSIQIWDPQTDERLSFINTNDSCVWDHIAFSPNGTRLAFSTNSQICVWDLDSEGIGLKDCTGFSTPGAQKSLSIGDRTHRKKIEPKTVRTKRYLRLYTAAH